MNEDLSKNIQALVSPQVYNALSEGGRFQQNPMCCSLNRAVAKAHSMITYTHELDFGHDTLRRESMWDSYQTARKPIRTD